MLEKARTAYCREMAREVIKKSLFKEPPIDIKQILNIYGFEYLEVDTFPDKLDALFLTHEGKHYAAVNKKNHPNRKNFSLAHELGHKLMNHTLEYYKTEITLDKPPDKYTHTQNEKIFETEANIFAGELLVPLKMLKIEYKKKPDIPELAKIFKVSDQVISKRISDHMGVLCK